MHNLPAQRRIDAIVPHPDNPFRDLMQEAIDNMATVSKTLTADGYKETEVTLTVKTRYVRMGFAKLYRNKELMDKLTPAACKIIVFMACRLDYGAQQMTILPQDTGMDKRTAMRAIKELMSHEILAKVEGKKATYWINVTLLIVGNLGKNTENQQHGA